MIRPRLLDLFCKEGGAGKGYADAGFDVVGVDIRPQPRYPYEFVQGDAVEYLAAHGHEFDAIHASPPCQAHSALARSNPHTYADFIPQTRALLCSTRSARCSSTCSPPHSAPDSSHYHMRSTRD